MHFRGPLTLKQFAVYTPSSSSKKREVSSSNHRRHGHKKFHRHSKAAEEHSEAKRDADMVIATIDGKVVSWVNDWTGLETSVAASSATQATEVVATIDGKVVSWANDWTGLQTSVLSNSAAQATSVVTWTTSAVTEVATSVSLQMSASSSSTATTTCTSTGTVTVSSAGMEGTGAYARIAYYDATSGTSDGLTFLGNYGGSGSGVFDMWVPTVQETCFQRLTVI